MYDCHTHSDISLDGSSAIRELAEAGRAAGLEGICLTEHLDIDYAEQDYDFLIDFDAYISAYQSEKNRLSDIRLLFGIEAGYQPHVLEPTQRILEAYPFDFIVNSVHCADRRDLYLPGYYAADRRGEIYTRYLEAVLESVNAGMTYSVAGHIGFVGKKALYADSALRYDDAPDLIDAILTKVITTGHGIELNTSGYDYISEPMPGSDILARYRRLGGEIVTVGSDAHDKADVAKHFSCAAELLLSLGYRYACYYERMEPRFYRL